MSRWKVGYNRFLRCQNYETNVSTVMINNSINIKRNNYLSSSHWTQNEMTICDMGSWIGKVIEITTCDIGSWLGRVIEMTTCDMGSWHVTWGPDLVKSYICGGVKHVNFKQKWCIMKIKFKQWRQQHHQHQQLHLT